MDPTISLCREMVAMRPASDVFTFDLADVGRSVLVNHAWPHRLVRRGDRYPLPANHRATTALPSHTVSCKFNFPRSRTPESEISGAVKINPTLAKSGNEKTQDSSEVVAQRCRI